MTPLLTGSPRGRRLRLPAVTHVACKARGADIAAKSLKRRCREVCHRRVTPHRPGTIGIFARARIEQRMETAPTPCRAGVLTITNSVARFAIGGSCAEVGLPRAPMSGFDRRPIRRMRKLGPWFRGLRGEAGR